MEPVPSDLEIKADTGDRNATFVIGDEDHTLGNALRYTISTKYVFVFVLEAKF